MRFVLPPSLSDQRGQMFAGYIVAILVLMALAISVVQRTAFFAKDRSNQYYREQAVNVARAGFEDGVSFFRRQADGVYLAAFPAYAPSSANRVTAGAWPLWPDSAFNPGVNDTDYFAQTVTRTVYNGTAVFVSAAALIRTIPLEDYDNTPTASDAKGSRLWGRYVLRRQNVRNWDPNNNTSAANTDPEAVHDLTHILSDNIPGTGNYWSIFSRGYVFTSATDVTDPAAFVSGSLLNAPLRTYQGKPFLRATAGVYGEITRLNFNTPNAAVFVGKGNQLSVLSTGIVETSLSGSYAYARGDTTTYTGSGQVSPSNSVMNVGVIPSVSYVFPGQTIQTLSNMTTNHCYSLADFPDSSTTNFSARVSQTTFLYSDGTGTTTFAAGDTHVLSGVGLAFFRGPLVIQAKNQSNWAGIVYVQGSVNIRGPGNISGLLIAEGPVTVGYSSDNDKAVLEYNSDAINATQTFLEQFSVISSSVIVTGN